LPVPDPGQLARGPSLAPQRLPAIPDPGADLAAIRNAVVALKELVEIMLGRRGDGGFSYVSVDELYGFIDGYMKARGLIPMNAPPVTPPTSEPKDAGPHRVRGQR
jgi:hypothetical protein